MGGNALQTVDTRRIDREEFLVLTKELSEILSGQSDYVQKFHILQSYRSKPDFGDIDVLIQSDGPNRDAWIRSTFKPKEIYRNSDVFSFDYKDVQVDFIFTKPENFQTSIDYFSHGDFGNLAGRVANSVGCRFGHDGLTLVVRDDTQVIGEIILSKDIDQILPFLGYDPVVFHQRFDTKEDIYRYVVSSPYYNYEIFDLDNRNYRARTRDRKRPMYTDFLIWAQEHVTENGYEWNSNKAAYLPRILYEFNKLDEYTAMLKNHFVSLDIKKKFNGDIVASLTGLQGKELGGFMSNFKKKFSRDDLSKMTGTMIEEEILNAFRGYDD